MTKNRRYEAHYDALNDRKIAEALPPPTTLPLERVRSRASRVGATRSVEAGGLGVDLMARPARRANPCFREGMERPGRRCHMGRRRRGDRHRRLAERGHTPRA